MIKEKKRKKRLISISSRESERKKIWCIRKKYHWLEKKITSDIFLVVYKYTKFSTTLKEKQKRNLIFIL